MVHLFAINNTSNCCRDSAARVPSVFSTAAAIYNYTTVIKSTCWNKIYALMLPLDGLLGSFGLLELLDQESGTGTEAINSGREDQEVVTKMDDFVTCYTAFQHLLCCLTL